MFCLLGSRDFEMVLNGAAEYTLTREDIGHHMAFVYIPVNFEGMLLSSGNTCFKALLCLIFFHLAGKEGESSSVVSEVVRQAPPKVTNTRIIGELREGSKITVTGAVTGGTEGSSRVQWFKSSSLTFAEEDGLEALSTSKISKAFRIPLAAVGHYIVAKFTPMTPDGEAGEPAYVVSEKTVDTLPPSLNFLSVTGEYAEGEMLTASYGYIGGHEGKSIYEWYLHEGEIDIGTSIKEASGHLQYRIPTDAIGKFISFKCIPARDDGMIGEPGVCMGQECVRAGNPRLISLQIVGKSVEGSTLLAEKRYWGGEEGESIFRWFRTGSDGQQLPIDGVSTSSYTLSVDDIGCYVSVSCEPVRSDWARGPIVVSEQFGPIEPGKWQIFDTPSVLRESPPTCQAIYFLGLMTEGQQLTFSASYSGGVRGNCFHEWFRVKHNGDKEKLCADDALDLALEDVGCRIEVVFTPVRKDGATGLPRSVISDVIMPGEGFRAVPNVEGQGCWKEKEVVSPSIFSLLTADPMGLELTLPACCEAEEVIPRKRYFGGQESVGEYIWYRIKDECHAPALIGLSDSCDNGVVCGRDLTYTPCLDDVGSFLALYWVPIREDGKRGKPLISVCDNPVAPAHPVVTNVRVKALNLSTYCGEGQYFGGHEGSSLFNWYRETADGTITVIDGANSRTYEVTDSDYNCRLLFGYTPVRSDSVVGELKLSDPTDVVLPGNLFYEKLSFSHDDLLSISFYSVPGVVIGGPPEFPKIYLVLVLHSQSPALEPCYSSFSPDTVVRRLLLPFSVVGVRRSLAGGEAVPFLSPSSCLVEISFSWSSSALLQFLFFYFGCSSNFVLIC
ncbi:hypothetical protein Cgig2_029251 [Carnegiea gigantea]|uniref:AIR9-like A9 domain-containing protein n=1 Tax=Carnegiea gigantea TaxID=171969 RepID=A0A9Q1KVY2_9CARY|nr:hypothetical protein Cgig2_029251 [Carnegiea gigantea]